jgi:hypothetical protein
LYKVQPYVEANVYLAAVYQTKHHDDDAKDALSEALAVKPTYRLDDKLAGGPLADLVVSVRRETAEGHKGSASIFTTPAGGKIFIDGELRGYGPLSLDRLPVGKHLVRFERPGYMNVGLVANITSTDDAIVKGRALPTPEFSEQEDGLAQSLKEVDSARCGPATFALLAHYKLERGIFANVSTSGDNLVLDLAMVDSAQRKRIAHRRNSFEGEDPENVAREVSHLVDGLLADAAAEDKPRDAKPAAEKDPLDSVNGMEDWGDDDDAPRKKHKSGGEGE